MLREAHRSHMEAAKSLAERVPGTRILIATSLYPGPSTARAWAHSTNSSSRRFYMPRPMHNKFITSFKNKQVENNFGFVPAPFLIYTLKRLLGRLVC